MNIRSRRSPLNPPDEHDLRPFERDFWRDPSGSLFAPWVALPCADDAHDFYHTHLFSDPVDEHIVGVDVA